MSSVESQKGVIMHCSTIFRWEPEVAISLYKDNALLVLFYFILFLFIYFHTWVGCPFSKADFQRGPIKTYVYSMQWKKNTKKWKVELQNNKTYLYIIHNYT